MFKVNSQTMADTQKLTVINCTNPINYFMEKLMEILVKK